MLRTNPAVTAIVSATVVGAQVYTWFSDLAHDRLCYVVVGSVAFRGGYSCNAWSVGWSGQQAVAGPGVPPLSSGKAVQRITSVTVRLNDGSSASGAVLSGRGFPFKVWFVSVPESYSAQLVFRDAGGHEVTHLTYNQQAGLGVRVPGHGGITVGGWTAYLTGGKVLWHGPDNGAIVPLPWTVKRKPLLVIYQETSALNYALGYAPAGVARLVLRMPDGHEYGGPTVPGWPGSGERLWVRSGLPYGGLPMGTVVISYDAAGRIVAQHTLASLLNG